MGYRKRSKKLSSNFYWNRSSSEPDLLSLPKSHSPPQSSRWRKLLPHEYITVDELVGFHRRRRKPDLYTQSSICVQNLSEPCLVGASEYSFQFSPLTTARNVPASLRRRATSLKLEGGMEILTEQKTKYKSYATEELSRSRPTLYKHPENLNLIGNVEYLPEYKSSYVPHDILEIPRRFSHGSRRRMGEYGGDELPKDSSYGRPRMPHPSECHLTLEGGCCGIPEYQSQYIEYPLEKRCHSIPQITSIKFQGDFKNIPEYKESFRSFENVTQSAPFRKADNLTLYGQKMEAAPLPEYQAQFKSSSSYKSADRTYPIRKADHLTMAGDFSKDMPEYNESFKDYHIKNMPERAKGRQPHFSLTGQGEFVPEYRHNFVDFPRSRPVVQKPHSGIILPIEERRFHPPNANVQKLTFVNNGNIHEPVLDNVPFHEVPEYRKAKTDYLIRERSTSRDRKILQENSGGGGRKSRENSPVKNRSPSPTFRMRVENVDDFGRTFAGAPSSPKYGRRANRNVIDENKNAIRNRTSIVEGNPRYLNKSSGYIRVENQQRASKNPDVSFVVLQEPCKQSAWMKPKWYDS